MLRITSLVQASGAVTLKVEGRLIGPWASELERVGRDALTAGTGVVLDLADVTFVDDAGADLLRRFGAAGVTLRGGSWFVNALVNGEHRESHR